ncbi:MAG: efflux RND transporter periplasmic adaptor subunit [Devosia sp.]
MRPVALAVALFIAAAQAAAQDVARYAGQIEAKETGVLSSQVNGVIAEVLFAGGEAVTQGQPLILLDPLDAEIALAAARANHDAATARLQGAEQDAARAMTLNTRGIGSDARRDQTETTRAEAAAALAQAEAILRQAEHDVERAVIRAPISGVISRPGVSVGAFVEAEAGPPLARIVALDPVLVAYQVPYEARLETLRRAGAQTVAELHERVSLIIQLPGGAAYNEPTRPSFASAEVDPATGAVTVWAEIANPDTLLRPGMAVTVLSKVTQ